ncbi:glycine dehydrogenase [Sistotremastrum suecicum HHB10207 ss-3]|uniref:Glycine cleavage system P protein n=1 Tax=Sistotremastrum suecicum HHB10207 ss-3 TaxID=1314776 RepID=A0A166IIW0_9AGAM|nr:glycine dehydrogenase [Sistotremastrum suecicum HHB10207 ss-3]
MSWRTLSRQHASSAWSRRPSTKSLLGSLNHARHSTPLASTSVATFSSLDTFAPRHIGPDDQEVQYMLKELGYDTKEAFLADTIPASIRIPSNVVTNETIPALTEGELLSRARELARKNSSFRSYIGMGYHNAVVPPVILRNLMENPAWYTPYTPYQPEIAQGRLESLVNFQTMVSSLTGMDLANASLLDEGTAAAEAMMMSFVSSGSKKRTFLVDQGVPAQTVAVLETRAKGFKLKLRIGDVLDASLIQELREDLCGVLVQFPDVNGKISDYSSLASELHQSGAYLVCASDLLALTMLKPPGEWGADIVLGNSARFGVPAGYGGPHAAFFAVSDKLKRKMPGRLIGLSRDVDGNPVYRLALQTREQHIRRERATSNICTSQALLANMAAMYAVYHGPGGLRKIAARVHDLAHILQTHIEGMGFKVLNKPFFDTLTVDISSSPETWKRLNKALLESKINLRVIDSSTVGVTLDESVTTQDFFDISGVFAKAAGIQPLSSISDIASTISSTIPSHQLRTSDFLQYPVFNKHHSETEMMRYMHHLQSKDLSLVHAMIPLGSCTMKLNSATSMIPLTWPEFSNVHPFVPLDQVTGYTEIIKELEADLSLLTGFHACSLQPNSGAAGEYAGLSVIQEYHASRGESHRNICLIPLSAHGTNPASAVMAGLTVVPVKTLNDGNLDLEDLESKAKKHSKNLAAFMITYPSTFGVFESGVQQACDIIHQHGGQVYLDGANLNAQVGFTNPATCGGDVCHLNLHKTFAIPHGGGGPGVGPICVKEHLAPFLPSHPVIATGGDKAMTAVSAAPFGSASILLISWAYIKMLGGKGLVDSTTSALLNANYIAYRLKPHYNVRYTNNGRVAHELLIDLAEFEKSAGLKVTDFAKRLQDFGFHPPTCSWPISTCMLIEPTESESLDELNRFCEAMIRIREEAEEIVIGKQPRDNNLLKNAPHPISVLALDDKAWRRPYSRAEAVYPLPWLRRHKFWPSVARVDDAYGDLNLICECPSVEELASSP